MTPNLNVFDTPRLSRDVRAALRHINENYHRHGVNGASVAASTGQNYNSLRCKFRQETRLTLKAYLTEVRLHHATRQLIDSDLQIKEIAWNTGWAKEDGLCRAFQKKYQMTPLSYRRMYRLNQSLAKALKKLK